MTPRRRLALFGAALALCACVSTAPPEPSPSIAGAPPPVGSGAGPGPGHRPIAPAASATAIRQPTSLAPRPSPVQPTSVPMRAAHVGPVVALLDDGRVLVAGGYDPHEEGRTDVARWELFDPGSDAFAAGGVLPGNLFPMAAVRVSDGRVFLPGWDARALLFDPTTLTFAWTGHPMRNHTYGLAIGLRDGRVLVTGGAAGEDVRQAELFDPGAGRFTVTGSMHTARADADATLLADGRVLVLGGDPEAADGSIRNSAEIFDPATGRFRPAGALADEQWLMTVTALADGRVLVIGELMDATQTDRFATAQVYDPGTGRFSHTGPLPFLDAPPTATLLPDGRVLVRDQPVYDPELGRASAPGTSVAYDPMTGSFDGVDVTNPYWTSEAVVLRDGRLLVVGDDGTALLVSP